MFYLIPLAGARRKMADRQRQPRLVSQALQLPFPKPQAPAIAAAAIGGEEQSPRLPIQAPALGAPPTADRRHRKRARVVVRARVDETGVAPQVVNPIGISARNLGSWKIMPVDLLRRPCLAPLAALILIVADQFLLLRVHRNDRFAYPQRLFDGAVDISELRVAVGMIAPLLGLAVALQTVTILLQKWADLVWLTGW